ncbi:hypothetical protein [Streptomyces sp. NPDC003660]
MVNTPAAYALALQDTAASIDRLRFHLRPQGSPPATPSVGDITGQIRVLTGIITEVSAEVVRLDADLSSSASVSMATEAYGAVLPLLGEGVTELGRLQQVVADGRFTILRDERPDGPFAWVYADITADCLEATDDVLHEAATGLRAAAGDLVSAPARTPNAARARSPHIHLAGPAAPESTVPAASPPSPAIRAAAKGH